MSETPKSYLRLLKGGKRSPEERADKKFLALEAGKLGLRMLAICGLLQVGIQVRDHYNGEHAEHPQESLAMLDQLSSEELAYFLKNGLSR